MDETITSILMAPIEVIGGFAALLVLLFALLRLRSRKRRAQRRKTRRAQRVETTTFADTAADPTAPAEALPQVTAYPMPVIGLIEERVYDELEDIASQSIMGHRVLTQLSLSAFLYAGSSGQSRADEQRVTAHLASLQVDFLIVDADWRPVVAVNIERDAVSASDALEVEGDICARAGIPYFIVNADGLSERRREEISGYLRAQEGIAAQ
jgi:type III secretory pathway component EscV